MPLTIVLLAAFNLAPASLAPRSAAVLSDGRAVQVVFQAPGSVAGSAPDWLPGRAAGMSIKTDKGLVLEHLGDVVTVPDGGLVWTATFLAPVPLSFGAEVTLTAPGGLLRDDKGNATAAFSSLRADNHSLVDADGFTTKHFQRGRGGVTLYVSSTHGDDRVTFAQAQTLKSPFKTIGRALNQAREYGQHGKGCALRLLRGDTFAGGVFIKTGGQDLAHPFIIETYWNPAYGADPGTRPVVAINETLAPTTPPGAPATALGSYGGGGTPPSVNWVVIRGIDFEAVNWTGGAANRYGLYFLHGGDGWTLDDCVINNFGTNLVFQGVDQPFKNVTLLRDIITDSRVDNTVTSEHTQGVFLDKVSGALISQCTIDNNGRVSADRTGRDIFSHNVYIQSTCGPAVVWGNAITNGGSHGVQLRPGGVFAYNYFGGNALAAVVGSPGGAQFNNVFEGSQDIDSKNPRGFGPEMNAAGRSSEFQVVEGNLILNTQGHQPQAITFVLPSPSFTIRNAVIRHNTVVNAGPVVLGFNSGRSGAPETSLTFSNNIFVPGGRAPAYTLPVCLEWGWLHATNNVLPAGLVVAKIGDRSVDLVGWSSVTGTEAGSIAQSPTFARPEASREFGALLNHLRTRPPGVWGDEFAMTVLYRTYTQAYSPTNLPELKAAEGGYYGAVDYRK